MTEHPLSDPSVAVTWAALQRAGGIGTPFLSWEWMSALADDAHLAAGVRVLVVRDGASTLGLLPVERSPGPARLRALGPAGWRWWHPDHADVVAAVGDRPAVAAAVVRHLAVDRSWDLLDLAALDAAGALAAAARSGLPRWAVRLPERPVVCPYVDLTAGDESRLIRSRTLRDQVRRSLRRAERSGGGLEVLGDPGAVERPLRGLMALHTARFGDTSEVFATEPRRAFHLRAVRRLAAAGMARVYRFAGAPDVDAGLLYALVLGPRLFYYQMGFDPDAAMSPGRTVLGQAILTAAREGFQEFDLLRGDHAFKQRFASGSRSDRRVSALRPGVRTARSLPELARLAGAARQSRREEQEAGG